MATERKAKAKVAVPIGLDSVYIAALKKDDEKGAEYEVPEYLARAIKATLSPILASGTLESDDEVEHDESEIVGYTVSIEASQLDDYIRAKVFGHRQDASGGVVVGKDDVAPEIALLFRTRLSDKENYKYTVLYKGKFQPNEESYETKKKDSITYSTEGAISGNFYTRTCDGVAKYSLRSDNATETGKAKIAAWFTSVPEPDAEAQAAG